MKPTCAETRSPPGTAGSARSACTTSVGRPTRTPWCTTALKSSDRRSRAGAGNTVLRRTARCGPCDGGPTGSHGRRASSCGRGNRGCGTDDGYWAGTCACSREGSPMCVLTGRFASPSPARRPVPSRSEPVDEPTRASADASGLSSLGPGGRIHKSDDSAEELLRCDYSRPVQPTRRRDHRFRRPVLRDQIIADTVAGANRSTVHDKPFPACGAHGVHMHPCLWTILWTGV